MRRWRVLGERIGYGFILKLGVFPSSLLVCVCVVLDVIVGEDRRSVAKIWLIQPRIIVVRQNHALTRAFLFAGMTLSLRNLLLSSWRRTTFQNEMSAFTTTALDIAFFPNAGYGGGFSVQELMIVLGVSSMTHSLLQFSQPNVIASLAVNQFADAGDACLWTTPQQTLSMRDSRRGSVSPGILDVFHRNTCKKAALRRLELPEVAL